jgi:glycine/D-amino acid oxidase-like deaminating enzyme
MTVWDGLRFFILGGGVSGLFLSYHLLAEGHDVILADSRRDRVRTSIYNAGQLSSRPSYTDVSISSEAVHVSALEKRRNRKWFSLARKQNRERYEEIAIELSLRSLKLYQQFFSKERAALDLIGQVLELHSSLPSSSSTSSSSLSSRDGSEGRFLTPGEVEQSGYEGFEGGGWLKEEKSLHSAKLLEHLRTRISDMGARVYEGVGGGGHDDAHLKKQQQDSDSRISYAIVNGESVTADAYVVAAGSWSRAVCRPLGYDPMIIPARGLVLFYRTHGKQLIDYPAHYVDEQVTITQHDKDTIRLTGFFELAGFNPRFSQRRMDWLFRTVTSHLIRPHDDLRLSDAGVGFRPSTPDQLPVVGRIPGCANGYILAGSCRKGMILAPILGRLLMRSILDSNGTTTTAAAADPMLHALDPGRFFG